MKLSEINIPVENLQLKGNLTIPSDANALVVFSHGSGSSRFSRRNRQVAEFLNRNNIATLLTDLLTEHEDSVFENRFDIDLLTERLVSALNHCLSLSELKDLPVGCFGASTGAASALRAAAAVPHIVKSVVSRGGRPDLAGPFLSSVNAPTLLIVGSLDTEVIALNEKAYSMLTCRKEIKIVEGATHLFEEPGKLEEVAELALGWFDKNLTSGIRLTKTK